MAKSQNINYQEESDFKKITDLVFRNKIFFLTCLIVALGGAFLVNQYSVPVYQITSSVLIKEDMNQGSGGNINDFLNSNLFGKNQNFQNELLTLQSVPVLEQAIKNLDLTVSYYKKENFMEFDAYKNAPFHILMAKKHVQPLNVRFNITFQGGDKILLTAEAKKLAFFDYSTNQVRYQKYDWTFNRNAMVGKLIESPDLSFMVVMDSNVKISEQESSAYSFSFINTSSLTNAFKDNFEFVILDKKATVIEISFLTPSIQKGKDLVNELMDVYSTQNLERKNHLASTTIDYIEKQIAETSDSLSKSEDNLQTFRSANQLLNVTEQATGITNQYRDLQNQRAELVTRKRYYDYVADYLSRHDDFSQLTIPASQGISDEILTSLLQQLISSQAERSNLISNNQSRNPRVKKLDIQIANLKKTISDNIGSVRQTTNISIDEMDKRVGRIGGQISNLPRTQRKLGGIERKYKLSESIYNYLLEKRAEAKITKASNLPDDIILAPARDSVPISPNKQKNFILAIILGLGFPFSYLIIKNSLNDKLTAQDNIERITDIPVIGKILHNNKKTNNVMLEFPASTVAESYRALRTNLDFYLKGGGKRKVIMILSCIEGEGKSFNALNIAMSYAQMGRKTILIDCDLRKPTDYFQKEGNTHFGVSSYLIEESTLEEIILKSPHEKLDYINSGPIPPNPSELLALDETKKMIEILRERYDYIIIDSPPLAQVTDGFLLIENADIKVVVARFNYSKIKILSLILKDLRQKKIENVCIVLNDNRVNQDQYGYGYGYNRKK